MTNRYTRKNKMNTIIKKSRKKIRGGKAIASGGFGCVFSPALKCKGSRKSDKNKISKIMSHKYAFKEYDEINELKGELKDIHNYADYFLIDDITICNPARLTNSDLQNFNKKCKALPKDNIKRKNINKNLDKLMIINMPNGGLPIDDYIYKYGSFSKILTAHNKLVGLLKHGIIEMNKKNIYHCDIKDSNVLIDNTDRTRLIDWGLSTKYIPFLNTTFPRTWNNRPLQFNVPFSVIIFTNDFTEQYTQFIKKGGQQNKDELTPFVMDYLKFWIKKRGKGHYNFINEIMFILFSNDIDLNTLNETDMAKTIETNFTIPYIINYIVEILIHFTKLNKEGTVDIREYLDKIFINIVDIWGFICVYFPLLDILYNNYDNLSPNQLKIFNYLKSILITYLYTPRVEKISLVNLYRDLDILGDLIKMETHIKTPESRELSTKNSSLQISTDSDTFKKSSNHNSKTIKIISKNLVLLSKK